MTDRTDQNAEALFIAARRGDKYAFFKLIPGFYRDIFSLVFKVIPHTERAEEVLTEIFVLAADNIAHVKKDRDVFEWLRKLSIIVALYDLRAKPLFNGNPGELAPLQPEFNETEKVYASLTDVERVVLTLFLQFGYSPSDIAGYVTGETEDSVKTLLSTKLERLGFFSGIKNIVTENKEWFHRLIELQGDPAIQRSAVAEGIPTEITEKYMEFIDVCSNLFPGILVKESILTIIRDELIDENKIRARRSRKKDARTQELNRIAENTARQTASPLGHKADVIVKKMAFRSGFIDRRRILLTLLTLAVISGAVYAYIYFSKFNTPWLLSRPDGDVAVNGTVNLEANVGDSVTTGLGSSVKMEIGEQAVVSIGENSWLAPLRGHKEQNIFSFRGTGLKLVTRIDTASFFEYADIPPFKIKTPEYDILTEIANLEANRRTVSLEFGWAEVQLKGEKISLATGYSVDVSGDLIMHVPVFEGTDSTQKSRIAFLNKNGLYGSSLTDLIVNAQDYDALSLIYLIKKSTRADKERIAAKLAEFYPAIDEEVQQGLVEENGDSVEYVLGFLKWILLF